MSFRWKVFLVSVAITVAIIVTTVGASRYFINKGIQETILSDLSVMAKLAENLVSSDIELLKARAWTAVHHLDRREVSLWPEILKKQVDSNELFLSITVIDDKRILASYGSPSLPFDLGDSPFAQLAREGRTVISTTRTTPSGELIFNICVPLEGDRVAAVTIPGLYLTNLVRDFKVWDTGSVFIVDNQGKILANANVSFVLKEYNVINEPDDTESVKSFREFVQTMIRGGEGQGSYTLDDKVRLAYYKSINTSNMGWVLAVAAPLRESPLAYVDQGVILMTLIFLVLGLLSAWLISGFVDRQFDIINKQYLNLSEMSDIASAALAAKTNFLANMSHEMRTPLNAIIGFSDLMLCGRFDDKESLDGLDKIHAAGLILLGIVNDILDISKIETGHLELIDNEYELSGLINDAVAVNLIRIGGKPIEFHLDVDPNLPASLVGDELRIKQIFSNLLSNAFKYTQSGRVDLVVFGRVEGESVWLTIQVKDTGMGIKKEDLNKLFAAYSQLDPKTNRAIEGTGLGLSITRKMVEMMDGKIEVESEYGHGSTFTITIRQKLGKVELIGEKSSSGRQESVDRLKSGAQIQRQIIPMPYARILLVDDVQANLDVAKGILKPYGIKVDCVTCGQAAVDLVREDKKRYNAIFMDHMMPGMDGIEATRRIREEIDSDYARKVPIIALTANAIIGNEQMFLKNGFQAYLTKPVNIHRMDQVLKQFVRDLEREALLSASQLDPSRANFNSNDGSAGDSSGPKGHNEGATIEIPGLSVDKAMARFGGDKEVYLGVLRSYCSSVQELVPKLEKPSSEKLKDYSITVHGLKSSSYGVGADAVGDLAKELEYHSNAGDMDFVLAHNQRFLSNIDRLVDGIRSFLGSKENLAKPLKNAPDPVILDKLLSRAINYDMDGMEEALASLEAFNYERQGHLTSWLREKVDQGSFVEIIERLSNLAEAGLDPEVQKRKPEEAPANSGTEE
ncbi:MAG: response regulator [Deltaproteobacteria bacterium]|jgi:signal transduction histidine kinase/CheY-like chemotaxis protein|nr:response regulator [Deltaproteobacteria bacterium]